jgi:hypothetical protein
VLLDVEFVDVAVGRDDRHGGLSVRFAHLDCNLDLLKLSQQEDQWHALWVKKAYANATPANDKVAVALDVRPVVSVG